MGVRREQHDQALQAEFPETPVQRNGERAVQMHSITLLPKQLLMPLATVRHVCDQNCLSWWYSEHFPVADRTAGETYNP